MTTNFQIALKIFLIGFLILGNIGSVSANGEFPSITSIPALTEINFNSYTPTAFGSEDVNPTMSIEDGGNTLHISGNSWKKISFSYAVTANTILEFDFKSTAQGEVHGVGFDNNQTMSPGYTYNLYGTQSWVGSLKPAFYQYDAFASDWRHYQIRVGEWYTGNMSYLVFVNDHDITNPTAHSYFRNVKVYEEDPDTPLSPISPPNTVDFDNYVITPYDGSAQSPDLNLTLEESGNNLNMNGNGWMKMSFPYEVTESTVIEFDFKSSNQGQIHGIGFDDNNSQQSDRTFKLYGSQGWGVNAFGYSLYQPEWKHYRIPVGKYYTGMMKYIFFVNDHDGTNPPTAESIFKNLQVYEGEVSLPLTLNFNNYAFSPYYSPVGGSAPPTINILDNGNTLHLSGNGWMQISVPINIMPETVLEFDFISTNQGEVHAIGFDTDQNADTTNTFKLYGTQNYGNLTYNDYASSAPNSKHYVIPIGQYMTGQQLYLFFANDHDIASPTGTSYFSNVQIKVQTDAYTYDRTAAVTYADDWAHDRNNSYPLANETGCGCNDCTNYISQVLHEGGYPLRIGNWNENNVFEWWFRDGSLFQPDYSKTWGVTDWLYNYTKIYNTEFEEKTNVSELMAGDFILLDIMNNDDHTKGPDGKPDHGRVVVGKGYPSEENIDYISQDKDIFGICHTTFHEVPPPPDDPVLLVNQHCIDRLHVVWNYNLTSNNRRFYIHVTE